MNNLMTREKWQTIKSRYSIYLVLIVMIIVCNLLNENFLSPRNISNISAQISVTTILAFGETILIIGGLLDLSCGSVLALAGVLSVFVFKETGSLSLAFAVGLLVGVLCNFVNGLLVRRFNIPAFIATLAMMTVARGIALLFTKGQNIYQIGDYVWFGQGKIGFVPLPVFFMIIVGLVTWYILGHTSFGRSLYAVGGNEEAARASGINVGRIKIGAYLINGAFVGLAGILLMARTNVGAPNAGQGYEFEALTAAIIGGTSFSGGLGTAGGTLAGAFIVGFLNNIMNLTGVDSYLQQVIKGGIIALAVGYDMWAKVNRTRKTLGAAKLPNERKEAKA
ncbi:Ribose import permease protein RbsC [Pleomorphomonas sp. T1.2MG-36]|uniref:ABC transporter permease n=1 Tax=Pleomorphomonas sp. T1.2MG-36 TaxID=3041167 RepID=UPI002477A4B0|nr:ABC transporter permease [Pleomorphomonas sp. T1.2MG-36]CAI9408594.1 Ribose import permease protein RbsC [Pleomorphomonas sp. T1.2MG-36]